MTDVLDRPTTVTGRDVWRDEVQAEFPEATPVVRPNVPSESFEALVTVFFARRQSRVLVAPDGLRVVVRSGSYPAAQTTMDAVVDSVIVKAEDQLVVHPATVATAELAEWLQTPLDAVVALVGLAPSTRSHWRQNPAAPVRPSKSGRLLRLHTAIGLLIGALGLERTRAALHSDGWLATQLDEPRLAALEAHVRDVLLPEGLTPPEYLSRGGLSREQILARMKDSAAFDADQRLAETPEPGVDAPEEP